jgi:hypothetical protein
MESPATEQQQASPVVRVIPSVGEVVTTEAPASKKTQPPQKLSNQQKADKKKEKKDRKLQQKMEQKEQRKEQQKQEPTKNTAFFQEIGESMADQLRVPAKSSIDGLDLVDRIRYAKLEAKMAAATTTTKGSSAGSAASTLVNKDGVRPSFSVKRKPVPSIAASQDNGSENSDSSTKSSASTGSAEPDRTMSMKYRKTGTIFTLDDFAAMVALEQLFSRYGRVSHMGILDKSYSFFVNKARTAALYFKVQNKVAVVGGDPVCEPQLFTPLLAEFKKYRKQFGWGLAFMGASDIFVAYAKEKKWATIQFGTERVLNPRTNPVLLEQTGKRIVVQAKQLLNPTKGGNTLGVYIPSQGEDPELQRELVGIYDAWRDERNTSNTPQAFITVYDPFSLPYLMTYIYTRGPDGVANGFAALRKIGANQGYHIDPCIATPGAPKGISDLLIFSAMSLLNQAGIDYLSFGFEPLDELGAISGIARPLEGVTRKIYRHTFPRLPITGKKAYHDKFRPDENQGSGLYLIFPSGVPGPRQMAAMAHMANISIRKVVFDDFKTKMAASFKRQSSDVDNDPPRTVEEATATAAAAAVSTAAKSPAVELAG